MRRVKKQHDYFIVLAAFALVVGSVFCLKESVHAKKTHGPTKDTVYEVVNQTQYKVEVFTNEVLDLDVYEAAKLEFEGCATSEKRFAQVPLLHFNIPLSGVEISATAKGQVIARYDLSEATISNAGNVIYVHLPEMKLSPMDVEFSYESKDGWFNDPRDADYEAANKAATLAMIDEAKAEHIELKAEQNIRQKIQDLVKEIAGNDLIVVFK